MSDYICEELIDEVFQRLPIKSLLRFRSLSKSWYSRISSPDFIRLHTLHSAKLKTPQKVLIQHRISGENFYTLHLDHQLPIDPTGGYNGTRAMKSPEGDIIGSCNGILCLHDYASDDISLWNPSIRRKLTLPHNYSFKKDRSIIGFGFDPTSDDYKVMRLSTFTHTERRKALVYSLKTGAWSEITPPSTRFSSFKSHACFFNGSLHWVVLGSKHHHIILTFDLSTQVFGTITLPKEPNNVIIHTIIYRGSLAVLYNSGCYNQIWVMNDYNNAASWNVVFKFETLRFKAGVDKILLLENGNLLIKIDPIVLKTNNPSGVCITLARCMHDSMTVDMEKYVETLALLDKGSACNADQPYFVRQRKNRSLFKRLGLPVRAPITCFGF